MSSRMKHDETSVGLNSSEEIKASLKIFCQILKHIAKFHADNYITNYKYSLVSEGQ